MKRIEHIQQEINRVKQLVNKYGHVPEPAAIFICLFMSQSIKQAEAAMASGDSAKMRAAHQELAGYSSETNKPQ